MKCMVVYKSTQKYLEKFYFNPSNIRLLQCVDVNKPLQKVSNSYVLTIDLNNICKKISKMNGS